MSIIKRVIEIKGCQRSEFGQMLNVDASIASFYTCYRGTPGNMVIDFETTDYLAAREYAECMEKFHGDEIIDHVNNSQPKEICYRVTWSIDVYATRPYHAALKAQAIMRDTESTANVFKISHGDHDIGEIDLD